MKNITLLMVLLAGLGCGYLIGDYRGKEARKALEQAIATGQSVDGQLRSANANLKSDLTEVNNKYQHDIEQLRDEYRTKTAEWERAKKGLNDTVQRQNVRLTELNGLLGELVAKLGGSSGSERRALEENIALLKHDIDELTREINGNVCLKESVPQSVLNSLNSSIHLGSSE